MNSCYVTYYGDIDSQEYNMTGVEQEMAISIHLNKCVMAYSKYDIGSHGTDNVAAQL